MCLYKIYYDFFLLVGSFYLFTLVSLVILAGVITDVYKDKSTSDSRTHDNDTSAEGISDSSHTTEPVEMPSIMNDGSFEEFFLEHIDELEQIRQFRLGMLSASQLYAPSVIVSEKEIPTERHNNSMEVAPSSLPEVLSRKKRAGLLGILKKFSSRVITWSLTAALGVSGINEVSEIQLGMVEWERFGNICFQKRSSGGSVSISFNSG